MIILIFLTIHQMGSASRNCGSRLFVKLLFIEIIEQMAYLSRKLGLYTLVSFFLINLQVI